MTLAEAKEGKHFIVTATRSDEVTMQAVRFGIGEGARIGIAKNIKGGPVIIALNEMELAVGRDVAFQIDVSEGG